MCLYPRLIKNPKYKATKKNGGIIPPIPDERVKYVPIGCQDCIECRRQKTREWQTRLLEEIRHSKNAKFITLTFSNESICKIIEQLKQETLPEGYELDNAIATRAVRLFLERWRKQYKKSLRHWLVTELGGNGTENIHLHGIVWTEQSYEDIRRIWNYGYIWPRERTETRTYVNEKTINYIVKYVSKQDKKHPGYKSRILTSAGIGRDFTKRTAMNGNKFNGKDTDETYRTRSGHRIALPIYWRNKIYSEHERELLWLQKLDKQERWICGERVDISKGDDTYYKLLEWYRAKNRELGYGNGQTTWNKAQYEQERRKLTIKNRIENAKATKGVKTSGTLQNHGWQEREGHKGVKYQIWVEDGRHINEITK